MADDDVGPLLVSVDVHLLELKNLALSFLHDAFSEVKNLGEREVLIDIITVDDVVSNVFSKRLGRSRALPLTNFAKPY